MSIVVRAGRRYPWVVATLVVGALGGVLSALGEGRATTLLLGGYAVLVAARAAWSMVRELREGTFGVDVLAVTAIGASVAVGELWAALVIVLMLTGGEALEDYAALRARADLSALLERAPQVAHRTLVDGTLEDVHVDEVAEGDQIVVRPGEVVPVDGTLESAAGELDESSLTGESLPVERVAGDVVLSGGVNGSVPLTLRVLRPARESQYQQIVALVAEAAASRAPMVRLADRYAIPFTALALSIASVAWWWSGDAVRFAEVLVVATPCPLIIAAPVAFMAGMSRSARKGVIVKSSATLEQLYRAKAVAFDKTGTLTRGEPRLSDVRTVDDADETLRLAASAEQLSSHVLASAVIDGAADRGLTLTSASDGHESTANGVTATVDGRRVVVGKRSFVAEATGHDVPAPELAAGELAVHVGIDGRYVGMLVLSDEIRPTSRETVASLRRTGVRHVVMLTGDGAQTAEHVAADVGIEDVRAECLPADKVDAVVGLTDRPVVMVGDGVNDAPVLAAADVGIAMGARGSTAASESADVVILQDDVALVATALTIGRDTVRVALQSIGVGIALSVGLMLVAAFGALPAVVGAWFQEGVDAVAILWALRAAGGARDRATLPRRQPRDAASGSPDASRGAEQRQPREGSPLGATSPRSAG
ncbi:heavy metal-(Cd/Co/Hg/Pb/Zn)-translocating P-type ATPase [Flavimobilis soli]|uniref:Heavy metal-(Cd/Co/Hg/Pb/Zn)-translocating P-type ATPase n=1 Tax=Flavimobilis soli TaxID=442709 RepID=A0A2A9EBH6_9MICO|nr:heavy metal-(Cd/Co/Hg/Pb/Zn)-translocating P-type ATPase [Flavimobilis soli]